MVDPWEPEFHPAGATGLVDALLFRNGQWLYQLELDGIAGGSRNPAGRAYSPYKVPRPGAVNRDAAQL